MDELQALQGLLQEFITGVQSVTQSGKILSPQFQSQAAEYLDVLTSTIEKLQTAVPAPIPPLDKAPFQSAVVNAFKYNPQTQDLYVKFQGDYPLENGSNYVYKNVPKFVYDIFKGGSVGPKTTGSNQWNSWKKGVLPSLGAALNALLKKGGFQYQKLV